MTTLRERIGIADSEKRKAVVDDACGVLDAEVADKGGLSGMAVKGAYRMVKGLRPGFLRATVDHLLGEFLDALDPLYQEAQEKQERPSEFLRKNQVRAGEALLTVTDTRAKNSDNSVARKLYEKLRPQAMAHVTAAVPRLGEMLDRHAG